LSTSIQILTANAPETRYKFCKIRENRARDTPLGRLYSTFDQISVKISVLGSYTLIVAPMGVKKSQHTCTSNIMSVLQMHGSMKNLEKTPGGGLSTIPSPTQKANINNAKSAIKVGLGVY